MRARRRSRALEKADLMIDVLGGGVYSAAVNDWMKKFPRTGKFLKISQSAQKLIHICWLTFSHVFTAFPSLRSQLIQHHIQTRTNRVWSIALPK
jgi:hypothetical protein